MLTVEGDRPASAAAFLSTLGAATLLGPDGEPVALRRKTLALLAFLRLEPGRTHARSELAALLWGDSPEAKARHSLTQTLRQLRAALPPDSIAVTPTTVKWQGGLECDAALLEEAASGSVPVRGDVELYAGDFLAGFSAGKGAEGFEDWADEKRAKYRALAVRSLDRLGAEAEDRADSERALELARRLVEIEPIFEEGHRRVMRAWGRLGERALALDHYARFAAWLEQELDAAPAPATQQIAAALRTEVAALPPSGNAPATGSAPGSQAAAAITLAAAGSSGAAAAETRSEAGASPPARVHTTGRAWRLALARGRWVPDRLHLALLAVLVALAALSATLLRPSQQPHSGRPLQDGVHFKSYQGPAIYLAFGGKRWEYPDWETLVACTGGHPTAVRTLTDMPAMPDGGSLPSVRYHRWMAGDAPIRSLPDRKLYLVNGCVKAEIAGPDTLRLLFPDVDERRLLSVPASVLRTVPTGPPARVPLRRAGMLIRPRGGSEMRWVTFTGGALSVPSPEVLASHCRERETEVDPEEFAAYRVMAVLHRSQTTCPT